ncbi:HAD-like protein [Rickenella mellea]|uniref:HAD-like protein n=1 Tax=Rickenella mellea TaxID=50990 RepID=A0A4R5XEL8_9AGAM|nr:HAD-like protein [Rickenella mellea]
MSESTTIIVDAILFDMDGTLIDSTGGVVGAWETFSKTYPFIDIPKILNTSHGVRTVDNLRNHCRIQDPHVLQEESIRFETEIINSSRSNGAEGIVVLPGVRQIMDDLRSSAKGTHDSPCWAICTSATRAYASQALEIAGISVPAVFITADDVEKGKPYPDPYLLGAFKCGKNPQRCLVIEDAPVGVTSSRAAGCKTLALTTTHSRDVIEASGPDFIVQDLGSVSVKVCTGGIAVTIALV